MRPDPDHAAYVAQWQGLYRDFLEKPGLAGRMLAKSHDWSERAFSKKDHFSRVLEVGAGTGIHLSRVRHGFDEYVMTDLSKPKLEAIEAAPDKLAKLKVAAEDATKLSFADASFDRVIAGHVLEHLPNPHLVLREWARVLKPGGVLTLILPCDPGAAWRLGRAVGSRGRFIRAGLAYDYWMAREHINSINNLVALIRYYFDEIEESWLPLRIPSMDLNLFYVAHIRLKERAA